MICLIRQTFLKRKSFLLFSTNHPFPPFLNLSFFPPFFKGGLGGIRGEHAHTLLFLQGDTSFPWNTILSLIVEEFSLYVSGFQGGTDCRDA
ncbi:MAG: hypothetical protein EDM77_11255 [Candidatus Jettenia sp. AMX1]|nr:MAG: hypothetical protein EDM77_11255 [Candidatus Jettenia sp. AMX1]MCE7881418.1 hypothetical protein [Candidatus Jettenia sp. AMX1]MCQ3927999.1 hypothetical protein [Candidatus Jettenia sp.]